jgi:DNA helicase II / ATP-dependent DNA helicase PcrA
LGSNNVNFANELNPVQWDAVKTTDGPVLILAGAGSGKTRALTYRIAYLVATEKARPDEIFAVTFTNKSAREMLERTGQLLSRIGWQTSEKLWISTFHSSCVRILRRHIDVLGYNSSFVIYDDSDQLSVLKKVCETLNINDKLYPAKTFQYQINEAKNQFLSASDIKKRNRGFMDEKLANVFSHYEEEMKRSNALDFNDLLLKTVHLFQASPEVLSFYQERFKYIMVDEYQDTNRVQYLLVQMLAKKYKNLCVVGDEDQSIYSWRGADITNILNFEKDFPEAKIIKLEQNYRSTKNIVEAASHVIRKNCERKDKTLWTANEAGSLIVVREESSEQEEARGVVREIQALARDDQKAFNEFAIFYRTNAQSRVLEDQLRSHQIPYKIVGGIKFYERAEVKDMLAYLRVLVNQQDSVSIKRIINTPTRGIGKTTIEKLEDYSISKKIPFFEGILPALQEKLLDSGATRKVLDFYEMINRLIGQVKEMSARDAYHAVLDATEYVNKLRIQDTPEAQARIENLEELDSAITEFEKERGDEATLAAFLEEIALVTDADKHDIENTNCVTLMTLHISKGLEFPVVFIVGLEDGLFPSARSLDEDNFGQGEEERRLFYVGMTRARQKLFLTYARMRKVWGSDQMFPPSRFLAEIPPQYIERVSKVIRPASSWRTEASAYEGTPNYDDFDSTHSNDESGSSDDLRKGMRVRHPSYGVGIIHLLEGFGDDQKVTILFPNKSLKKFVVKFARLERV